MVAMAAPRTQDKDENRVKDGVDDGAEQHGYHGEFRTAIRTNHGVECDRDHGKGQADGDDIAVLQRGWTQDVGCTEQGQDGVHKDDGDDQHGDTGNGNHDGCISHTLFDAVQITFA